MHQFPANYDAVLKEQQKVGGHTLTIAKVQPAKMWALYRYVFLNKTPLLDRLPLDLTDNFKWQALKGELSRDAYVELRGLVRQFPSLPWLAEWRRVTKGRKHEGLELPAAIGVDIIGRYPDVNGRFMELMWGAWLDMRDVSGVECGYVVKDGTHYPYGHQMAYWSLEGEDKLLENFSEERRRDVAVWEFQLDHEPRAPFYIGLAGFDEYEAINSTYRHVATSRCTPNLVATYFKSADAADAFALRHQGEPRDAPLRVVLTT